MPITVFSQLLWHISRNIFKVHSAERTFPKTAHLCSKTLVNLQKAVTHPEPLIHVFKPPLSTSVAPVQCSSVQAAPCSQTVVTLLP